MRRSSRSTDEYDGQKLFTVQNGKRLATPLFAVLILIETTDVVFAVDSIPAILAVSREPFIVFASNAFAILGLRSLYFLLGGMQDKFRYLNVGLGVILGFVGVKMLITELPLPHLGQPRRDHGGAHRHHRGVAPRRQARPTPPAGGTTRRARRSRCRCRHQYGIRHTHRRRLISRAPAETRGRSGHNVVARSRRASKRR